MRGEVLIDNFTLQGIYRYVCAGDRNTVSSQCLEILLDSPVLYDQVSVPRSVPKHHRTQIKPEVFVFRTEPSDAITGFSFLAGHAPHVGLAPVADRDFQAFAQTLPRASLRRVPQREHLNPGPIGQLRLGRAELLRVEPRSLSP